MKTYKSICSDTEKQIKMLPFCAGWNVMFRSVYYHHETLNAALNTTLRTQT